MSLRMLPPLFLIPVRGGSKGIPRKNMQEVAGISLVGRAVRAARDACAILGGGRVVVDSDDAELLAEGRRWGAETPYVRPAELAGDTAGSMDVVRHALGALAVADRLADEGLSLPCSVGISEQQLDHICAVLGA